MKNKSGLTVVELIVLMAIITLVVGSLGSLGGIAFDKNYGYGSKSGVVVKVSRVGVLFKSWEGEIQVGSANLTPDHANTSVTFNTFDFNIDPTLASQVEEAYHNGQAVQLQYRQWFSKPWWINNDCVVTNITYFTNSIDNTNSP